jgi:acyl-CoA dehydrogenase
MADRTYLTWPFFDDQHRELATALAAWSEREVRPFEHADDDPDGLTRRFVERLGRDGWLRYCVPAAHGGAHERLDVRSLCLARETLASICGLADFAFAMQALGSAPISLFGTAAQQAQYLPAVRDGRHLAAFALSEPEAGSDVGALSTSAVLDDESYVLNGFKTWISNAGLAAHYVVFARTEASAAKGLSAFIVDADLPGLSVVERLKIIAPHPIGTLRLADCRVPASHLLGRPGDGFRIAMATLDVLRSTVAAAALGMARRALDEAVARARDRLAFGQPIAEFQLIQQKLADMAVEIDAGALLVYRAAWTKDTQTDRVTREAAMAKLYATEAAQRVVDAAVQIFGGLGVVVGIPVERLYREVRALRIYEGTSEIQKLVIARQVLAAPRHS